jgi:hypothetical protein
MLSIGCYAQFANPVLHSELKTHALYIKLQWMMSVQHWSWRLTYLVLRPALRSSPCSTLLPDIIFLQSCLYKVIGCFLCCFRLPWPSLVAGIFVTVSNMLTAWTKGPESAYYDFSLTLSLTWHLHFISSFSNFAYLISLIPGHESLIYDLFYLSLTHVYHFDSPWTIIRYDSYFALTHTFSI